MNDNSYNGKVQALLNSTTDQEFLRILKNHRPQFYVSGPLDVDWNQLTMLLMGHVAKHDFVQSARTLGELSKHRFFVHGMMHAQSQQMVEALVPPDFHDRPKFYDDVHRLMNTPVPPFVRPFIASITDPHLIEIMMMAAAKKGLLDNILLLEQHITPSLARRMMRFAFEESHMDLLEYLYTPEHAKNILMVHEARITRNAKQYNNHQQAEQHLQYLLARSQAEAISQEIDIAAAGSKPRKL